MHSSLKDTLVFSNYCWESTSKRIRYLVLSLLKKQRVIYIEPPVLGMTSMAKLNESYSPEGVVVLTPYLPLQTTQEEKNKITHELLEIFITQESIRIFDSWYFSHPAWDYSRDIRHQNIIYHIDKEDELHNPLAEIAQSIFSSRRLNHEEAVHIADGVDFEHFSQARLSLIKPDDISQIPSPRIGCYGLYKEDLLREIADKRPDLQFILLKHHGPLQRPNIHYLGFKNFYSLPLYLSHWDAALTSDDTIHSMELLASGTPTILINDEYQADTDLIYQARNIEEVSYKIDLALQQKNRDPYWIDRVDLYLNNKNWDHQIELMLQGQTAARPKSDALWSLNQ